MRDACLALVRKLSSICKFLLLLLCLHGVKVRAIGKDGILRNMLQLLLMLVGMEGDVLVRKLERRAVAVVVLGWIGHALRRRMQEDARGGWRADAVGGGCRVQLRWTSFVYIFSSSDAVVRALFRFRPLPPPIARSKKTLLSTRHNGRH